MGNKPFKEKLDRIDTQANEILKQALGGKWEEDSYEEIRKCPNQIGFTSAYLYDFYCRNLDYYGEFSSSADVKTLLKLAKLDIEKGATIPELVFTCCWYFPKKEAIESVLQLRKENETEKKAFKSVYSSWWSSWWSWWFPKREAIESVIQVHKEMETEEELIKSVLQFKGFRDDLGANCLTILFQMPTAYRSTTKKFLSGEMLRDIEESCLFLIRKAKESELDLAKLLNHMTTHGSTLFSLASAFSETMTKQLLTEKVVRVNSIDLAFLTPFFRVRSNLSF